MLANLKQKYWRWCIYQRQSQRHIIRALLHENHNYNVCLELLELLNDNNLEKLATDNWSWGVLAARRIKSGEVLWRVCKNKSLDNRVRWSALLELEEKHGAELSEEWIQEIAEDCCTEKLHGSVTSNSIQEALKIYDKIDNPSVKLKELLASTRERIEAREKLDDEIDWNAISDSMNKEGWSKVD